MSLFDRVRPSPIRRTGSREARPPELSALRPGDPERLARLIRLVDDVNRSGGTYHRLDFGGGLVMHGAYDMAEALARYPIPHDLRGRSVLDVGTGSGLLALECARRGAGVTAIDVHSGALLERLAPLLEAEVRYRALDVYDLPSDLGSFDLVLCNSLLLHLPDPLRALRRLRDVCRDQIVVSTQSPPERVSRGADPICHFVGERGADGEYWTYWSIGREALRRMLLAAGFSRVDREGYFTLVGSGSGAGFATPHVVARGHVS